MVDSFVYLSSVIACTFSKLCDTLIFSYNAMLFFTFIDHLLLSRFISIFYFRAWMWIDHSMVFGQVVSVATA